MAESPERCSPETFTVLLLARPQYKIKNFLNAYAPVAMMNSKNDQAGCIHSRSPPGLQCGSAWHPVLAIMPSNAQGWPCFLHLLWED